MSEKIVKKKVGPIRNFSIIAHIDHGKSTLADRIIELCKVEQEHRGKNAYKERILDTLELEQEKGITIKLQPVQLQWKGYELNIIDTPGHVDFAYEVSRSLHACESAVLLIDATQGVQAQTISTLQKANDAGLVIIPALNKIDVPGVNIENRLLEIETLLGIDRESVVQVSGRTGENVEQLLNRIVQDTPEPKTSELDNDRFQALIFDSFYDEHKGVMISIRVFAGEVAKKSYGAAQFPELHILRKKLRFTPIEFGIFTPEMKEVEKLTTGQVGYIATGLKDIKHFTVGDTVSNKIDTPALPGYQPPKANVFATFFPTDTNDYESLKTAMDKLLLNDSSLTYTYQKSNLLGTGFRCGFLGLLHMEIVQERLEREFDVDLLVTAPTVEYRVITTNDEELVIQTAQELPDPTQIKQVLEPWARVDIMTPAEYIGPLMQLCEQKRGEYVNTKYLNQEGDIAKQYVSLHYDMPLASLISNFFDLLKNLSSGYASMEYEFIDFLPVDVVKVSILVNKEDISVLGFLETRELARERAMKILEVMKEVVPRQQFEVPIQASIGAKIIGRVNVRAFRKDVTAKLYGGDYSRKKKLLEKQKKGKKRMKQMGNVTIPQEAFLAILKT